MDRDDEMLDTTCWEEQSKHFRQPSNFPKNFHLLFRGPRLVYSSEATIETIYLGSCALSDIWRRAEPISDTFDL